MWYLIKPILLVLWYIIAYIFYVIIYILAFIFVLIFLFKILYPREIYNNIGYWSTSRPFGKIREESDEEYVEFKSPHGIIMYNLKRFDIINE